VLVLALFAVAATLVAGVSAWTDFLTLIRRVSDPIATEHNMTPGAVSFQLGVPRELATILQVVTTLAAVALVIWASRAAEPAAGYLVTVVASQLVSPILWDHYAMLLLLPVAWLLERRQWWAAAVPLVTAVLLVGTTPSVVYPLLFAVVAVAVAWLGRIPAYQRKPPESLRPLLAPEP
jgi:hypothetical protein